MKPDKRKFNPGGARPGAGRDALPAEQRKQPLAFQVKKKFHEKARAILQPIVDRINQEEI